MATYLDFEQKIRQIQESIISAKVRHDDLEMKYLEEKLDKEVSKVYGNLTDFQKLQLARHIDRPYALDYINIIMRDKYEIHGDRHFRDDAAIVCYLGYIGDEKVFINKVFLDATCPQSKQTDYKKCAVKIYKV